MFSVCRAALALLAGFFFAGGSWAELQRLAPAVHEAVDFARTFDDGEVINSLSASASIRQTSGSVNLPGIFLHPAGTEDSILRFSEVYVPDGESFLFFSIGMRDGIPWGREGKSKPNGVRFSVAIDGSVLFEKVHAESAWEPYAISLTQWARRPVLVEFRVNAIDGNTNYDWSMFGDPRICRVNAVAAEDFPKDANGLALAQVVCDAPSSVAVSVGERVVEVALGAETRWIPIEFDSLGEVALTVTQGEARLGTVLLAPYAAQVEEEWRALSTPLLTAGAPFSVVAQMRNMGRGALREPIVSSLYLRTPRGTTEPAAQARLEKLAAGEKALMQWRGAVAGTSGEWRVNGPVHVFAPPPSLPEEPLGGPTARCFEGKRVRAIVGNAKCRVVIVAERTGHAYGVAETWNGQAWQRLGSLYPLVQLTTATVGVPADHEMILTESRVEGDSLILTFFDVRRQRPTLRLTPDGDEARIHLAADSRIHLSAYAEADLGTDVLRFGPPVLLAGDRAFGVKKDFAIFPGLEYLEGDEPSSSERDLAYPLSERHVPAAHKIATPLMAVQAEDALAALLWDMGQEWAPGERHPAARFEAPAFDSGFEHLHLSVFAPSVGEYVPENAHRAETPYALDAREAMTLEAWLVLDHAANYGQDSIVHGPHKGGLVLQAFRHYFDLFGLPAPSPQPRTWEAEKALCMRGYLEAVWGEDPPGWAHCYQWDPGLLVGHAVPQVLVKYDGAAPDMAGEIDRRVKAVLGRAVEERGPHYLWSQAGCHILCGELPFFHGFLAESMRDFQRTGYRAIRKGREDGLWRWHPRPEKQYQDLGQDGDHTLSQAARPSMLALRAARLTGDRSLATEALEAMKQMASYEVPRGAQTWECPLYQPDILAAAQAIRAYCEAYRLTGDEGHLENARYWAWTGLPFLYLWELEGYPTMRYNVISVIGSTFYTHSWLGLPVVWCGLVYAYALQDLAEFDDTLDWGAIAQGITNSAMHQQYADGPNAGTYPDSWNMVENRPNPADINPENILVNEFRRRGFSPHIRFHALPGTPDGGVLNANADIANVTGGIGEDALDFTLRAPEGMTVHALVAPARVPAAVNGNPSPTPDSAALLAANEGWLYDEELQAAIIKTTGTRGEREISIAW